MLSRSTSRSQISPSPTDLTFQSRRSSRMKLVLSAVGVLIALLILLSSLQLPTGADSPECRSIYMYPSYAHLKGFDTSHTKFATKYNLYLYREQGKDTVPDSSLGHGEFHRLDGIPVLFIPGNAGSFKQVRSIAAQAANIYHEHRDDPQWRGKNMDFFAAHFNEDFTAFHGRTMLDQAEYLNDAIRFILSLYAYQENAPTSVIIIGHSMGGVVSRVMLTLPNYVEDSVNTIITLAAPHAAAPATFDGDIMRIYAATDKFWRAGYSDTEQTVAKKRLQDVSLISITGGLSDSILPADYTTMTGIVPETHGFTVYTTGIPGVWTPIDHLAIVWCDQFRKAVVSTLFDIVAPYTATRTLSLQDRMKTFRGHLLSGTETYKDQDILTEGSTTTIQMSIRNDHIEHEEGSMTWTTGDGMTHLFSLAHTQDPSFSLLTTVKPQELGDDATQSSLLLCNITSRTNHETQGSTEFACFDVSELAVFAAPNPEAPSLKDSSFGATVAPYYAVELSGETLSNHTHVMYKAPAQFGVNGFTTATLTTTSVSHIHNTDSDLDFITGSSVTIPSPSLHTKITFDNVWNSVFAYTLKVDQASGKSPFPPFLNQAIQNPMETKWHLNLSEEKYISFHGIAPFTPYKTLQNSLEVNLWLPSGTKDVKVTLKIDFFKTLRLLVLRYRLAIASFPTFVITLTLLIQFQRFYATGIFPAFEDGLSILAGKSFLVMGTLALLTPLLCGSVSQKVLYWLDPIALTNPGDLSGVRLNPYFLGLQDPHFWFLGPMCYLLGFAAVNIVLLVMRVVLWCIPYLLSLVTSMPMLNVMKLQDEVVSTTIKEFATGSIRDKRRVLGVLLLLVFVMFYIPYQFAYVVACIAQVITTIKVHITGEKSHKEKVDLRGRNIANFNLSLLMLMLWIIPVNAPVLVVFFHNMAVRWKTPFTSHHNILAILPILLLVGRNVQGHFLPQTNVPLQRKFTYAILGYFAFFTLVYGIRHLYWLHYLLNLFCAWLFIMTMWNA